MLARPSLAGLSFLDIGCGSGLFSLAALRLGAARVNSFDSDPQSVACAAQLRRRYAIPGCVWQIERGSVLDPAYLAGLGPWDVVYAWGVLHHTGALAAALANVVPLVGPGGPLCVSIYNDQGAASQRWRRIKRFYNRGRWGKWLVEAVCVPGFVLKGAARDLLRGRSPLRRYREYGQDRGMSLLHDLRDWLGGYPFEVATPEAIFAFYRRRGFTLQRLKTARGGHGCNEFVFHRPAPRVTPE
jgi:2-polyprenyl-6-hydroxyphenyl methylase/3-demethylubiquinone-9 3-methyltransferase